MVLNRAQGLRKKSHEVSAQKNNNRLRYNNKCRGGGADSAPPALLGLSNANLQNISEICTNQISFPVTADWCVFLLAFDVIFCLCLV